MHTQPESAAEATAAPQVSPEEETDPAWTGTPPSSLWAGYPGRIEPVILRVRPGLGWAKSRLHQRVLAACAPLIVVGVYLACTLGGGAGAGYSLLSLAVLGLGPLAFFQAARVLRPYSSEVGTERRLRHGCAAVASAHGGAIGVVLWLDPAVNPLAQVWWVLVAGALLLGPVTLVWGGCGVVGRWIVWLNRSKDEHH